jgi:hypothetical protein
MHPVNRGWFQLLPACCLVVFFADCALFAGGAAPSGSPTPTPGQSSAAVANHDRIVTRSDGARYVVTGHNNVAHRLMDPGLWSKGPGLLPRPKLGANLPCQPVTIASASGTPDHYDLQALGYMTPVRDQLQRGNCNTYASMGDLEMEYVIDYSNKHHLNKEQTAAYAKTVQFSEQYLDVVRNIANGPGQGYLDGSIDAQDLLMLNPTCGGVPTLALPPLVQWPQIQRRETMDYEMMLPVPLPTVGSSTTPAVDTLTFEALLNMQSPNGISPSNGRSAVLNWELADLAWNFAPNAASSPTPSPAADQADNYQGMFPPPAVHEAAQYAPLKVVQIEHYDAVTYKADSNGNPVWVINGSLKHGIPLETLPDGCGATTIWDFPVVTPERGETPAQKKCYEILAAPYEALLAQDHPIAFGADVDVWNRDTFSYMPQTANGTTAMVLDFSQTGNYYGQKVPLQFPYLPDHAMLLIGYDRQHHLFHFRNSWGDTWGASDSTQEGDGTAWMTYDLLLRTIHDALYIDGVWHGGNVPNGIWFGLWRGSLNGDKGVAVVDRFVGGFSTDVESQNKIWIGSLGNPGGIFYGASGAQTPFQMMSWSLDPSSQTYSADFWDMSSSQLLFTLKKTMGSSLPQAAFVSAGGQVASAPWSKCETQVAYNYVVQPASIQDLTTASDPYLLPPCGKDTQPWRVSPSWSCRAGDTYEEYVGYDYPSGGQNANTVQRGCLNTSGPPRCPSWAGPMKLMRDQEPIQYTQSLEVVSPSGFDFLDVCMWLNSDGSPDTSCLQSQNGCWTPACSTPKSVFGVPQAVLNLGADYYDDTQHNLSNNGDWVRQGQDLCVRSAYPPAPVCPDGYVLSPNGNDCFLAMRTCGTGYKPADDLTCLPVVLPPLKGVGLKTGPASSPTKALTGAPPR